MDADEFRRYGKEIIDFVADYLDGDLRSRLVAPKVEPGYLKKLLPEKAPTEAGSFADVMNDVRHAIMPGVMNWHSPNFHAYFPSGNSYPTICAEILSATIGGVGFSWTSNPACTELEVIMMDWLGKMLQLPEEFLSGGKGGGVIQGTASEATLVALLGARSKKLSSMKTTYPSRTDADVIGKLVAYCSDQAHSSVERACLLNVVRCHKVASDDSDEMTAEALKSAIKEDRLKGLIPFFVVATLGTTPGCTFDHLKDIGPVCQSADVWLHIDAAYAGSAFICPEFRPLLDGVEWADSFNFNPHKWLMVNFDCSAMWMKDCSYVVDTFNVDPLYLKHQHQGEVPDYRQVLLAKEFEKLVRSDPRFVVTHKVTMGLVCFKLKDRGNDVNEELLKSINDDRRIHMVSSKSKGVVFLRFAICGTRTELDDVRFAWRVILEATERLLGEELPQSKGVCRCPSNDLAISAL